MIANTAVKEDAPEEQTFRGVRGKVRCMSAKNLSGRVPWMAVSSVDG